MSIGTIYVISVCDRDGYFIPVLAATTEPAARDMLAKWRKQNEKNEYWEDVDDCTVVPLYREFQGTTPSDIEYE